MRRLAHLAASGAIVTLILLSSARPTPAPEASPQASPTVRADFERISDELLCYCGCSRLTVKECTCGVAFDLRDQFESKLAGGESADSIIAAYIAEHGEQARNVPPKKGFNLLAWFGPGIAILVAGAATILTLMFWVSQGRKKAKEAAPAPEVTAEEEAMHRRVESDLKEYEL